MLKRILQQFQLLPVCRTLVAYGMTMVLLLASAPPVWAQTSPILDPAVSVRANAVRGQVSIARDVQIAPENYKVSLNMRDADIRDVLNMLAKEGDFNLLLDESVTGQLTLDVKDITINKALEYIFTVMDLSYTRDQNTLIVASKEMAETKSLTNKTFKALRVKYKNASDVSDMLNKTVFSFSRPGGSKEAASYSDPASNSVYIMGTDSDIRMAMAAIEEIDIPRNRKVYYIRHNDPSYVANVLMANFFNDSNDSGSGGGGSGAASGSGSSAGGGAGAGAGAGAGGAGGGAGSGAGAGAGAGGAGGGAGATGPTTFQSSTVMLIADPIPGTLTVMATAEQIALIDDIMPQVDVRRPQVAIEVALVELANVDVKQFIPQWDTLISGNFRLQMLPGAGLTNLLSYNTHAHQNGNPLFGNFSITHQDTSTQSKVLANPTLVTMDRQQASIDITDEVATVNSTTVTSGGAATITTTITKEQAGVSLAITPQINNDGSVILTMTPTVSQPLRPFTSGGSSTFLLNNRSMTLAGVRVQDGQTLVIGGLIREIENLDIRRVPGLSQLPIVGAMFRSSGVSPNNKNKTEMVIMVTPHILKEEGVTYFTQPPVADNYANPNLGSGMQPVSLPRFTLPDEKVNPEDQHAPNVRVKVKTSTADVMDGPIQPSKLIENRSMFETGIQDKGAKVPVSKILNAEEDPVNTLHMIDP